MCKLGQRDERVVAITAAMPDGTGLMLSEKDQLWLGIQDTFKFN